MNDNLPPSLNRFAAELEHAIRRELAPRRAQRLSRVLRARRRLLAGTSIGAAGTATVLALVLSAAGSTPAFAVTRHRDGSYSVTLRSLSAIPAANAKLARMGVHARFQQVPADCTATSVAVGSNALLGAGQNLTIPARALRHKGTVTIAAWRKAGRVQIAPASSVPVPGAAGSGNSGNNGNNLAVSTTAPSQNWGNCVGQSRGAGNSGNSGNSGDSGSSGKSGSGNSGNS